MKLLSPFFLAVALALGVAHAGQPVDVNSASAEEIAAALDGIGLSKAKAIVSYRKQHGPFEHADELVKVKGIGLRTVDRNREFIELRKPANARERRKG